MLWLHPTIMAEGVPTPMDGRLADYFKATPHLARYLLRRLNPLGGGDALSRLRITYVPGFDSREDFVDQYYRMVWYMHPILDNLERVYVSFPSGDPQEKELPSYMDPTILDFEQELDGKLHIFPDNVGHWEKHLSQADILMLWKSDFRHSNRAVDFLMRSALKTKKKWRVDRHRVQYEGSFYLKLSHDANKHQKKDLDESRGKLRELAATLAGERKGYVFGTGPSLASAMDYDFSDGVTVICNSIVRNKPLVKHLDPRIITVADPIFHAGCSSYAGEFRRHLCDVMDNYDTYLIVPFRDYVVYTKNLPQRYQERIIGIPLEHIDKVNLNLQDRFVVKSTSNVLTLFLIPVAATFFDEIGILGCDGRKLEDNGYFWSHHEESQFNEEMEAIRQAHPAFFALDYDDYYLAHCEVLEQWLSEGEKRGITFLSLTESFIPALRKRSVRS